MGSGYYHIMIYLNTNFLSDLFSFQGISLSTSWYATGDREQAGVRLQADGGQMRKR